MKYKKKLESYINKTNSNKKIKGGTVSKDQLEIYYGLYIIAIIYNDYCIRLRLWCMKYLSISSTDIKTDRSISQFIHKYYVEFKEIYSTTIKELILNKSKNISDIDIDIDTFTSRVIDNFRRLFELYEPLLRDNYFKLFIPDKTYIFEIFKNLNIIVDCDNEDVQEKLYELYALHLMALINYKLHQEISLFNKYIGYFYYNIPEVSDENIRECVDFYNKRLYDLKFQGDFVQQKQLFEEADRDNLEKYKNKIKSQTLIYVDSFIDYLKTKHSLQISMLSIFLEEYDSNIEREIIYFMDEGINNLVTTFRDISIEVNMFYSNYDLTKYEKTFQKYLAMDTAIKSKNVLQQFTLPS